jgi:hypothetical protein
VGGSWTTAHWPAANSTSYADTGLTAGTWCYRIRSHTADEFSAYVESSPTCVAVGGGSGGGGGGGGAPAAPGNLRATAVSSGTINLTWNDNSNDENSFKLQRRTPTSSWTTITWPLANSTSYADSGRSAGTWCYRIRSHSTDGFSTYVESTPACVSIVGGGGGGTGTPQAPTAFQIGVINGNVGMQWQTNAADISSFKMQWAEAGSNEWTTVWMSASDRTFVHSPPGSGNYCYRIRTHYADDFSEYVSSSPNCVFVPPPWWCWWCSADVGPAAPAGASLTADPDRVSSLPPFSRAETPPASLPLRREALVPTSRRGSLPARANPSPFA